MSATKTAADVPAPSGTQPRAVYLVKGDDPSLVAQATHALVDQLVAGGDLALMVEEFGGPGVEPFDVGAVIDACTTPPFLVDRRVVVVRDPDGKWRDEALLSSDLSLTAEQVIVGYMKRWSVEVAYCDCKQLLGFHDPMVRTEQSVQRAHPMAWFTGALVVLWYAQTGINEEQAHRHRPWYKNKISPTFADMLSCLRLASWCEWLDDEPEKHEEKLSWLLEYIATAA